MVSTPTPDSTGGGTASSAFSADPAAIATAGAALVQCSRDIASARRYGRISGAGEAMAVENQAAAFRESWSEPLTRWTTSLGTYGSAVSRVGAHIAVTETGRAQDWKSMSGQVGR